MKKMILLFLLSVVAFQLSAQWTQLNSNTNANLFGVKFLNQDYGVVVGENGTVLKTLDGGNTWTLLSVGNSDNFKDVALIGHDTIFISSINQPNAASIYRSNDGGQTWENVLTDPATLNVCSTPDNHLYAAAGLIYESEDNGANWMTEYDIGGTVVPFSIQFYDKQTGNVGANVGGFVTYSAIVIRTANAGNSWWELDNFDFPNANALTAFSFTNSDTGYLFTNHYSFFTPNDSSSLIRVRGFQLTPLFGDSIWSFGYDVINTQFPDFVTDCKFFNDHTAYCVGNNGPVYISFDDGATWGKDYFGTSSLYDLDMLDVNNGYAVGANGTILKKNLSTAVVEHAITLSDLQVSPNPAFDATTLLFTVKENTDVSIAISNVSGSKMNEIQNVRAVKGINTIKLETESWKPGVYFVHLTTGEESVTRKIIISR